MIKKLIHTTFFTPHEMATITILGDIIIPKDEVSGSASDAKVPDFIEFIVKDKPEHQMPMRGGLRWLDMQCLKRYKNPLQIVTNSNKLKWLMNCLAEKSKTRNETGRYIF